MHLADKAGIIGQLWIEFRNDEDFSAFMEYNDLGAPMGYMLAEGLIRELSPFGEGMVEETFEMFLKLIDVTEEELDALENPDLDLTSILQYSYNKRNEAE